MSDWVEYCNLPSEGMWAKLRIENGHSEPYKTSGSGGIRYPAVWQCKPVFECGDS